MGRYRKGDQVEVQITKGTLEDSWHPARIVGSNGDVCTVLYAGHANRVVKERVLVRCIRPCPPLVEFSNWSRGDLVHVFDDFAWKLAAVLQVLDKKQFLVRVIGSMQDLKVGAAWIRVRHYWQDDHWIVVGKRPPSNSDVKRPFILRNMISDSQTRQRNHQAARRSTYQKSHNVPSRAVKRKVPGTLGQTEAQRGLMKISRTAGRSSPGTLIQTEACTGTGMRSRVTEQQERMSHPPATNANLREAQNEQQQDSGLSSVGSCSINSNFSGHHYSPKKFAAHQCEDDVSDAESCTEPSPKPRKQTAGILVSEKGREAFPDRPSRRCSLVIRFWLQDPLLRRVAL